MDNQFWTAFWANLPALVASLIALLGAVGAFVQTLRNAKQTSNLAIQVEEVHKATNGLVDKLVDKTATSSHAAGKIEGRAEGVTAERSRLMVQRLNLLDLSGSQGVGPLLLPPTPGARPPSGQTGFSGVIVLDGSMVPEGECYDVVVVPYSNPPEWPAPAANTIFVMGATNQLPFHFPWCGGAWPPQVCVWQNQAPPIVPEMHEVIDQNGCIWTALLASSTPGTGANLGSWHNCYTWDFVQQQAVLAAGSILKKVAVE